MPHITWDQETKDKWVAIMQAHQDADDFIQGSWFDEESGKGCFFGCAMQTENNPLEQAIEDMKLPAWLVYLAEEIHEGLPREDAKKWPLTLCKAIPVDVDIEMIQCELSILRLTKLADKNPSVADECNRVIQCCKSFIGGESDIDWLKEEENLAHFAAESARLVERDALLRLLSGTRASLSPINHGEDITITPQTRDEIVSELEKAINNLAVIEQLQQQTGQLDLPTRIENGSKQVKIKALLETLK